MVSNKSVKTKTEELKDLLVAYDNAARQMVLAGEKLGEALVELLRPIIPDIDYQLGDYEAGPNMLVLRSKSMEKKMEKKLFYSYFKNLENIISEELNWWAQAGFYVYACSYFGVGKKQEKKIRELFRR